MPDNTRGELFYHLARLHVVREQIRAIEKARLQKLEADRERKKSPHAMVRLIARVVGIGVETAEVFSRQFRDRKAVARYAGLPAPRMRAANAGVRRVLPTPVALASAPA